MARTDDNGASNLAHVCVQLRPLPEQRDIAAVHSDTGAEIDSLEQRLAKTRAIKWGMVQQLRTRAIRRTLLDATRQDDGARDA